MPPEVPPVSTTLRIWPSASTNLVDWENLGLFTNVTGQSFFNDPSSTKRPANFYRLNQVP